jgi:hypothetical protein
MSSGLPLRIATATTVFCSNKWSTTPAFFGPDYGIASDFSIGYNMSLDSERGIGLSSASHSWRRVLQPPALKFQGNQPDRRKCSAARPPIVPERSPNLLPLLCRLPLNPQMKDL